MSRGAIGGWAVMHRIRRPGLPSRRRAPSGVGLPGAGRVVLLPALAAAAFLGSGTRHAHAYTAAVDYALNCQGCHRADGAETPGSVPALAGSVARFLAVPGGREYLVRVPGVSQAPLDDAALAALLNWMLERFDAAHVPKPFTPYGAEEVGRLRKAPLTDVESMRRRLLEAVERQARAVNGG